MNWNSAEHHPSPLKNKIFLWGRALVALSRLPYHPGSGSEWGWGEL